MMDAEIQHRTLLSHPVVNSYVYYLTSNALSIIVFFMCTHNDPQSSTSIVVAAPTFTMTPGGKRHASQRNPGDTRIVGIPLPEPISIQPASVPWGPVTWLAPAIAEWVATLHFAVTGRTDALAPWLANQLGRSDVDARRLLAGATKWPLDNLATLLDQFGYVGGIYHHGDVLPLFEDKRIMHEETFTWVQDTFLHATGDNLTGPKLRDWLIEDAKTYHDETIESGMAGLSVPSRSHASLICRGGSPINTYLLYRVSRAANARGMWTSMNAAVLPSAQTLSLPGGMVIRTIEWRGRPVEPGRYGSQPIEGGAADGD